MKKILMTLIVTATSWCTLANEWTDPETGITWIYLISDGEASVGYGSSYNTAVPKSTTGAITIPTTLSGCPVTCIAREAFYKCSGVTGITIPEGVTSIGDEAFCGCSGMMSFSVAAGNPNYKSVDGFLLSKDGKTLMHGINGSVTIPNGVTSIGNGAFSGHSGLTSVTIPNGVTSIGEAAFADCSGLTSVTIPEGATSIGTCAFSCCGGLTRVTIPSSVASIGNYAFSYCKAITSITIPNAVTSIGEGTFDGCSGLTSVSIPECVTSIGDCAFSGCEGLASVSIPEGVTSIGLRAFSHCYGLTNVTIPSSVTSIYNWAFVSCINMMEFSVAEGNPNYKSVNGLLLSKDGKTLMYGINGNVTIPESVTTISNMAFYRYDELKGVDFEGAPPSGLKNACIKKDAAIRYNVVYEDEWLPVIKECGFTNTTSYTVSKKDGGPYSETVEGVEWMFKVENSKACVTKANPVKGPVTIPSTLGGRTVTSIDDEAFYDCSKMTSVAISEGVTSIGFRAFSGCSGLKSVTIPASVKTIGEWAFEECPSLADVYFEGDTISSIGADAFRSCYWDLIMHVPATWQGRGRTICGYTVLKGSMFIVK